MEDEGGSEVASLCDNLHLEQVHTRSSMLESFLHKIFVSQSTSFEMNWM